MGDTLAAKNTPLSWRLPLVGRLFRRLARSREKHERWKDMPFPPGHFYSPMPSLREIRRREREIFDDVPGELPGIDLNEAAQFRLLDEFAGYYKDLPFHERKTEGSRYYFENPTYSYSDATVLYCMIRHLRPKRIIEVGSGFSSAAILDTNELAFEGAIACTFIEPYPKLLTSLLKDGEEKSVEIVPEKLQDVDPAAFDVLSSGDILLIDSTHVAKTGSDVNRALFEILPRLEKGVHVHFHDVFYPFEYPKEWVYQRIAWNEAYILRAFLQYNRAFEIAFFSSYLGRMHVDRFAKAMPVCLKDRGGSIWLRRV